MFHLSLEIIFAEKKKTKKKITFIVWFIVFVVTELISNIWYDRGLLWATSQENMCPGFAQLMRLVRVLKFRLKQVEVLYYPGSENKGADQTAQMRRLICGFVVCIWQTQVFSWCSSYNKGYWKGGSQHQIQFVEIGTLACNEFLESSVNWFL